MKYFLKNLFFALAAVPILLKLPYLMAVWRETPLDSKDMYIWLSLPMIALFSELLRRHLKIVDVVENYRKLTLLVLIFALISYAVIAFKVNAAGILLGIMIFSLAVELRFGRRVFVSQFPTMFFAVLSCPSLSYWLDYYLHTGISSSTSYFLIKIFLGLTFFIYWNISTFVNRSYPRISSVLFCVFVLFAIFFFKVKTQSLEAGDEFKIDTNKMYAGNWISEKVPGSYSDKRFFASSPIERRAYFNNDSNVNLLALKVNDISKVHPIGICLKSAGYDVSSSKQIYLPVGDKTLQVNELEIFNGESHYIAYSFFSNGRYTTGDFTKFRFSKRSQNQWMHYQIIAPFTENEEISRARVQNLLKNFSFRE